MSRAGHHHSRRHTPRVARPLAQRQPARPSIESDQLRGWRTDRAEAAGKAFAARQAQYAARREAEHEEADEHAARAERFEAEAARLDQVIAKFGGRQ